METFSHKLRRTTNSGLLLAFVLYACGGNPSQGETQEANDALTGSPVQLLSARLTGGPCPDCIQVKAQILVENIAFEKVVALVFAAGPNSWQEAQARYVGPADANREIWSVQTQVTPLMDVQMAVRYEVAGRTFWDNNSGKDYLLIHTFPGLIADGINVLLRQSYPLRNRLYQTVGGEIFVRNVGFQKTINVVYSTDHWSTAKSTPANYADGPFEDGLELWSFSIQETAQDVDFAIGYTVDGVTYWDNNFGHNYFQAFNP